MASDFTVVSISKQELIKLEMIVVDGDKDGALAFLKDMRSRIKNTVQGMTSHLDS
jgi:hypothetical protein